MSADTSTPPLFAPERVVAMRTRLGWSQRTLARVLGIGGDGAAIEAVRMLERRGSADRLRAAILARIDALPAARAPQIARAARDDDMLSAIARLLSYDVPRHAGGVSDAAITAALRDAKGNVEDAADALGCAYSSLFERLRATPELWPDGVERGAARRRTRNPYGRGGISDEEAARTRAALLAARGDFAEAGKALGLRPASVRMRCRARDDVWPEELGARSFGARKRPSPKAAKRPLSAAILGDTHEAIRAADGVVAAAARALGLSAQGLHARLVVHPEAWPAGVKRRQGRRGRPPRTSAVPRAPRPGAADAPTAGDPAASGGTGLGS